MSQREFADWLRFETEWPLPDQLDNRLNALICLVVANIVHGDGPSPQLDDFMFKRRVSDAPAPPTRPAPAPPTISTAERFRIAMYGGG